MAGAVVPQSLADGVYFIPMLDGTNFSDWKDSVQFTLGYMDLDYALRVEQPPAATDTDAQEVIENRQWWERSNRLSLMLIKSRMSKSIRGSIGDCATIKELMQAIEEQFVRSDKALANTLIRQFTTKAFDSSKGMRAYITEMRDIVSQLKGLKIEISEPFLVHFILDSLPSEYGPFKISYNTHKENWSVTDLLTMCVQEEKRMKHDRPESANMVVNDKVKIEKGQSGPQKKRKHNVLSKSNGSNGKKVTCFFCKKERHVKKSCIKYKEWLEKKGSSISLGFLTRRKPTTSELWVFTGNKGLSQVVAIGVFRVILKLGHNKILVGSGTLVDNLFKLDIHPDFEENYLSLHSVGIKRNFLNEKSSLLWHKRLGHISIERMRRLVKEGVLQDLDFTDFKNCVDCIKGKQTINNSKGSRRSSSVLEIIRTDICGPFSTPCLNGQRYFISFIDDYSRFMYLYLLNEKAQALDVFKAYKAEVENQSEKKIKIVRSDRGGEYYGRYTEHGQIKGPFANFL
ncbi:uncharacterized protein LOC122312714 [Carya illinoinensis]|uniref:uncharacterized protein LOC122312714 n=1 Tax=Carya illinoinensis TaxID=32201 RepID=UPI001C71FFEF|nr:uncharacterized protein LOC122312714 [Carya illinoinensis]